MAAEDEQPRRGAVSARLPVLEDLPDPNGAHVLVRADLNVPLRTNAQGEVDVADDLRLRASLPTLTWLIEQGAHVTVCSHLGRPHGRVDPALSMAPVRRRLDALVPGSRSERTCGSTPVRKPTIRPSWPAWWPGRTST